MENLTRFVPKPGETVCWEALENQFSSLLQPLGQTPQNPRWHGEGDVLTHTKMVVEALLRLPGYQNASRQIREILFFAALFHDAGKALCTRLEDGVWVSRGHGNAGACLVREQLFRDFGLSGEQNAQMFRETVCRLIQFHSTPVYALENPDPHRRLRQIAACGEQTPLFTLELLCLLSEADIRGRLSCDRDAQLEKVELCRELAKEAHCYNAPYPFVSEYARFSYLNGVNMAADQPLYDPTWGKVYMLSGLPATGKDTWIRAHLGDLPMISLDEIRQELSYAPTKNQAIIAEKGHEMAKAYLRKKQSFVWNATDLTPMQRQRQVELFCRYGGCVEIVYLETGWQELLRRNRERTREVPRDAIEKMLQKLEPPMPWEGHRVTWLCL